MTEVTKRSILGLQKVKSRPEETAGADPCSEADGSTRPRVDAARPPAFRCRAPRRQRARWRRGSRTESRTRDGEARAGLTVEVRNGYGVRRRSHQLMPSVLRPWPPGL